MAPFDPALLATAAAVGLVAGVLGGMLGIGGGVVIVPALLLLFESRGVDIALAAPMAVGTSLATIIFTSASAARAQLRRGTVEWSIVRQWIPFLLAGGLASGHVAGLFPPGWLPVFIGLFLLLAASMMFANWKPAPHRSLPGGMRGGGIGFSAGLTSGLAGIGGGNIIVPTLVFFNTPVLRATATSSTLGVPIALAGSLGFIWAGWYQPDLPAGTLGYIHWPVAMALLAVSVLAAPIGVALAHRTPAARLKRLFALVLMLAAARVLYSGLGAILGGS